MLRIADKNKSMGLFKESEIKKMIGFVNSGQMSFSRMVELMNMDVYRHQAKIGELVTMMDVVRTLEAFLVHNEHVKSQTEIKVKALIDYMKSEVIIGAKSNIRQQ